MAIVGLLLGAGVSVLEVAGAGIVAATIQLATAAEDSTVTLPGIGDVESLLPGTDRRSDLAWMALFGSLFFVLRGTAVIVQQYVSYRSSFSLAVRLTDRVTARLFTNSYMWHLTRNSAELSSLSVTVCQNFAVKVYTPIQLAGAQALTILGLLAVALAVEPVGAVGAGVALGLVVAVSLSSTRRHLNVLSEIEVQEQLRSQRLTTEAFQAIREVKLLDLSSPIRARIGESRRRSSRAQRASSTIVATPRTVIETVAFCALVVLVAHRAQGDSTSALAGVGVLGYAVIRILPTANNVITHINTVRSGQASARRLADLLEMTPEAQENRGVEDARLPLAASNLSFSYPTSEPVLAGIDLQVRAGQSVGLVGTTGCGKSTLLDLLAGLISPTEGSIQLDGTPLDRCRSSWWEQIGIVPQHITLLDTTLAENVAMGVPLDQIDRPALQRAVDLAQLTDVVERLPDGFDTAIGERGVRLSGGQRQRLAIARALYRDPLVIFMDEGTSALDAETELAVVSGLRADRAERTLIMVAHRVSTLQECDEILVLDAGRIAERGTFSELVETSARFRRLAAADPS